MDRSLLNILKIQVYKPIQFDLEEYKKDIGCEVLLKETKEEVLQQRQVNY